MDSFARDNGYPPTVREICKATGLRSPRSVSQHLQALERKGYIERGRDKSRAIRFLHTSINTGASSGAVVRLPLMGKVAAGVATSMDALEDATYNIDRQLVDGDQSFLMKVEGDSMINAHIMEGDYIVVNPEPATKNGDVVVARVGTETTVKRFESRADGIYLVPENPRMDPIDISTHGSDVRILGKVVGLIRRLN
jgi:repressor LexA